jgi:hypothetical protein
MVLMRLIGKIFSKVIKKVVRVEARKVVKIAVKASVIASVKDKIDARKDELKETADQRKQELQDRLTQRAAERADADAKRSAEVGVPVQLPGSGELLTHGIHGMLKNALISPLRGIRKLAAVRHDIAVAKVVRLSHAVHVKAPPQGQPVVSFHAQVQNRAKVFFNSLGPVKDSTDPANVSKQTITKA